MVPCGSVEQYRAKFGKLLRIALILLVLLISCVGYGGPGRNRLPHSIVAVSVTGLDAVCRSPGPLTLSFLRWFLLFQRREILLQPCPDFGPFPIISRKHSFMPGWRALLACCALLAGCKEQLIGLQASGSDGFSTCNG